MKKILLLCCLATALQTFAQNVPTPEFKNKVMFFEKNALVDLEKTDLSSDLHTNMGGHSEVNLVAVGKNSTSQHSGSATDKYIVKIESGIDPANVVELFKFEEGKKKRKVLVAQMSMGRDKPVELPKEKLIFKKIDDGVYEINSGSQLGKGEYCFMVNRPNISILGAANSQSLIGYCFSVQ